MDANELQAARSYLLSVAPSCCAWADDATAIVWDEGPAITFREELSAIFERHATRGLPPLLPVLLVLSACRESWSEAESAIIRLVSELSSVERHLPEWVGGVLTSLEEIHRLSTGELSDLNARAELVDYLFDGISKERTTPQTAAAVLQLLAAPLPPDWFVPADLWHSRDFNLWRELGLLKRCLERFDAAAFQRRLRTTLDRELKPAEVELPPGQRVRRLLTSLRDDPELAGLASLAKQLLACVSLPLPLLEPDEVQLGGVSDITNRGTLDRLLVSELAHDDHTLAVRVATRESLYLRREAPPRSPPRCRTIVLDSGVRMWGTPRVFATAVGMALGATAGKGLQIEAYRASGPALLAVDLTRRAGLEQHLAALETEAHVGAALPAIERLQSATRDAMDLVIVTSAEAVADPEFVQQLRAAALSDVWLAAVDRSGRLQLLKAGQRELLRVREAQLDLESLFVEPSTAAADPLIDSGLDLPAYCKLSEPPLRLPHSLSADRAWETIDGHVLAIHKDHRLTWWDEAALGPLELASNMPPGRVHWISKTSGHEQQAVVGMLSPRGLHLLSVDLRSRDVELTPLELPATDPPRSVHGIGSVLFVRCNESLVAFSRTGHRLGSVPIPRHHQHFMGPLFYDNVAGQWLLPSLLHGRPGWTALSRHGRIEQIRCLAWPQGELEAELQAITHDGCLFTFSSGEKQRLLPSTAIGPFVVSGASRLENQFQLGDTASGRQFLVYRTASGKWAVREPHTMGLEPILHQRMAACRNLRRHFKGIIAAPTRLSLISTRGHELRLEAQPGKIVLRDMGVCKAEANELRRFLSADAVGDFITGRADWPDGSTAWLDARGLLHLRSSDSDIPELAIVLHEGQTAVWSSSGEMHGPAYFLGHERGLANGHTFAAELHRFLARLA